MLTVEQAQTQILAKLSPLPAEAVPIERAAGRVLAHGLHARRDLPSFDNSAMDGYAVLAADVAAATVAEPVTLKVVEAIAAGATPQLRVTSGCAARIFTGAPMPAGADAVVMQEETQAPQEGEVHIMGGATPGQHVRRCGEDVAAGAALLPANTPLNLGAVGLLAAQGYALVNVVRAARVAILPTGDELQEIDAPLAHGQIANSNSHQIAAQVRSAGGIPIMLPPAKDSRTALREALEHAARGVDLIVTCGGVSVGDFDYVREIMTQEGEVEFWRVAMKPGKPLAFGQFAGVPLLGLPGNPVSSFVCFELFGRPALRKLAGHPQPLRPAARAVLAAPHRPNGKRREFIRATLAYAGEQVVATPLSMQGSAHLLALARADALLDIPPGDALLAAGAGVRVLPLN